MEMQKIESYFQCFPTANMNYTCVGLRQLQFSKPLIINSMVNVSVNNSTFQFELNLHFTFNNFHFLSFSQYM